MTFSERLIVGIEYSSYVKRNNLMIPHRIKDRRKMFIRWYMERYRKKTIDDTFRILADELLYIKEVTLYSIIFNAKQDIRN